MLTTLKNKASLKCAIILRFRGDDLCKRVILKLNYTKEDYEKFLSKLNFEYNCGQGGYELFGIVWLEDNTWLSRDQVQDSGYDDKEHDVFEWWNHNIVPEIYTECI